MTTKKGSFWSSLLLIIISTLLALAIARVAFRLIANELVVTMKVAPGEYVKHKEYGRWPSNNLLRLGNRKGELDNFPLVHDSYGFTPGRLPDALLDGRLSGFTHDQRQFLLTHYINIAPLYRTSDSQSRQQILFTIGDSNIRVNFEHLRQMVHPETVLLSDSFGIPSTGPDRYHFAVTRWLAPGGDVDEYLKNNPLIDLEVDVYITPNNDLVDLRGKPDPEKTRLVFPQVNKVDGVGGKAEVSQPTVVATESHKSERLRSIANILGLNVVEMTVLRSILGRILPTSSFSDSSLFKPSLEKPAMRRALAYLDMIEQELERYVTRQRQVRMNLVVLPSVYDMPSMKLAYTWDDLMDDYVAGAYLMPGTDRYVQVKNLRLRELFQAWHLTDEDYALLFDKGDLHYTASGMVELSIALAFRKGFLPEDWLEGQGKLKDSRKTWLRENLLEQHLIIMRELRRAVGEQD